MALRLGKAQIDANFGSYALSRALMAIDKIETVTVRQIRVGAEARYLEKGSRYGF